MRRFLLYIALGLVLAAPVHAVEPDEILADPVLEDRARDISKGLRCVVCQNQDIDSSNAGVARDLRLLVRERLVAGDSNEDVVDYVRARYGDYVMMAPPLTPATYALWFAPGVLAVLSLLAFIIVTRRRQRGSQAVLTPEEEERIALYLKGNQHGAGK